MADYDYRQPVAYFVTFCTCQRACVLGDIDRAGEFVPSPAGRIVQGGWRALPQRFPTVELDAMVIMPNHVHAIVVLTDGWRRTGGETPPLPALGDVVAYWKYCSARDVNAASGTPGAFRWQRGYYEHAVRGTRDLERFRVYIAENAVRWREDEDYVGPR
ncbi:MAG: transposase [Armatimonadetes bacterium]|nr:transposase [Armatimonadota bacterium]